MKTFTIIFLSIIFIFLLFLWSVSFNYKYRGKLKEFLIKTLKYIGLYIGVILLIAVFVALFVICYKIVKNLFVAAIITIGISLLVGKLLNWL